MEESTGILVPPEGASQRERNQFYQDLRRNARAASGRCRYCGLLPEAGRKTCARCLELARRRDADRRERERARREAERRAALPRRCAGCGGDNLAPAGQKRGRRRFNCRDCGRSSYGDGLPPPPPSYPCPYCKGQCIKRGRSLRVKRHPLIFSCTVCGRCNTMLWPEDTPSPGGPFPHRKRFHLNYPAFQALMTYCQEHQRSVAQAIREIFIAAGAKPPLYAAVTRGAFGIKSVGSSIPRSYYAPLPPAPPLPVIPPEGVRFPSALPEAQAKLAKHRFAGKYAPSILVAFTAQVKLNDAALAGLLAVMRRRGLNHQDAARAVIAESVRGEPIIVATPKDDGGLDGW